MNFIIQSVVFSLAITLLSCESDPSVQADQRSKVKETAIAEEKLSYERVEVLLFDSPAMSNTFRIGEQMSMNIIDIKGLNAKNGQYDLGMSFSTMSEQGDTIVSVKDIFEIQQVSYAVSEQVNIPFYIDFFKPYQPNMNYKIHIKVWDKNGHKSFDLEKDIKVLPEQANGFVKTEGDIKLDYLIVYRNTTPYTGNEFYAGELINFTWALPQSFLEKLPAVKTSLKVFNVQGQTIYEDSESATLTNEQPKISNKVYLKPEDFPVGSYDFEQEFKAVNSGELLKIKYRFEVKEVAEVM